MRHVEQPITAFLCRWQKIIDRFPYTTKNGKVTKTGSKTVSATKRPLKQKYRMTNNHTVEWGGGAGVGGGALFYGVSQSIATHALFIKMENEIGLQVRSIRKASSFYVSLVYCHPTDFEICLLYDQIYVRRSLVVSWTST